MQKRIVVAAGIAAFAVAGSYGDVKVNAVAREGIDFSKKTTTTDASDFGGSKTTDYSTESLGTPDWAKGGRVYVQTEVSDPTESIGATLFVESQGGEIQVGDEAKIWGNIGFAKFQIGKIKEDTLRGYVFNFGKREIKTQDEDTVFTRIQTEKGIVASFRPLDSLFLAYGIDAAKGTVDSSTGEIVYKDASGNATYKTVPETFYESQIAAGYDIALGGSANLQVKAQYIGDATYGYNGVLEFGTKFNPDKSDKNQVFELGVKLPLYKNESYRLSDTGEDDYAYFGGKYFEATAAALGHFKNVFYKGHLFGSLSSYSSSTFSPLVGALSQSAGAAFASFDSIKKVPTIGADFTADVLFGIFDVGFAVNYQISWVKDSTSYDFSGGLAPAQYTFGIDTKYTQQIVGGEIFISKNLGASRENPLGYGSIIIGIADLYTVGSLDIDTSAPGLNGTYTQATNKFYIPVGFEFHF